MIEQLRSRWLLIGTIVLGLAVLSVACIQVAPRIMPALAPSLSQQKPDDLGVQAAATIGIVQVNATPSARNSRLVAVRRGAISESLPLNGVVAGREEARLSLTMPGRVVSVPVKPGQPVKEGDVLLETDAKQTVRDLNAARARLEASTLRLQQAQAQAQARQEDAAQRARTDQMRQQDVVTEAQAAVRRAQVDLDRVKAGPSRAERDAAQAAIASAQAVVDRAETDLARATAGATIDTVQAAQQTVTEARLALQRAESEQARLKRGANPADVRAAESAVATAQSSVDRAQADLDRLTRGPDPDLVKSAERDIERAQNGLQAAEAVKADATSRVARDTAVADAKLRLQDAQDRLAKLKAPPNPGDVEIAKRNLQVAQTALDTAQQRLDAVRQGPDQLSNSAADAGVASARLTLKQAEARLSDLQSGPSDDTLGQLSNAVDAAHIQLSSAQARLAELISHPTPAELRDAQDRVAAAQMSLQHAGTTSSASDSTSSSDYDLIVLQRAIEQDRSEVASLEADLTASRISAPFAGTVTAVEARPGDMLEARQVVIVLAKPGEPILQVQLIDKDAERVAVGQTASVQLDGADPGAGLSASVTAIVAGDGGVGRIAQFKVAWPAAPPSFGTSAQVGVVVQQKDNVLVVPRNALRSAGARQYVEYMDGSTRKVANVQVGIITAQDAEIVGGVNEGQLVLRGL